MLGALKENRVNILFGGTTKARFTSEDDYDYNSAFLNCLISFPAQGLCVSKRHLLVSGSGSSRVTGFASHGGKAVSLDQSSQNNHGFLNCKLAPIQSFRPSPKKVTISRDIAPFAKRSGGNCQDPPKHDYDVGINENNHSIPFAPRPQASFAIAVRETSAAG